MMQLQINRHRQEQSQNYQFNVINHGKLPHSSYYDLLDQEPSIENAAEEALIEDDQNTRQNGFINENLKVWACAFSPEPHDYLAWSCGYGLLRLLSLTSSSWLSKQHIPVEIDIGETITSLAFGSSCSSFKHRRHAACSGVYRRFHFDEKNNMLILAIGLTSGRIRIYNARDARFLFGLFDHSGLVSDLKFTQDGSLQLCSASADSTLKLWNMYDDGNMYMTLHGHTGTVYGCDWSPVANILCSVGANRDALIWSLDNNQILHRLKGHLNDVVSCQFSPDGGLLATASFDTRVCLWDPYTGILIRQLLHLVPVPGFIYAGGHNGSFVRDLKWSSNGDVLVTICDDGKIRIWSVIDNFKSVVEATHRNGLRLAFSSKWRTLFVGNRNGYLERFEVNLPVPKLTALCRKVVNQLVDRNNIEKLYLPLELKNYLTYDDFKQTFGNKNQIIEKNFN